VPDAGRERILSTDGRGPKTGSPRRLKPVLYTVADMSCLFCKIVEGSIPSKAVYQDEQCYAFLDIDPKAPLHVLVIPRKHIASLAAAEAEDSALLGHLLWVAAEIARKNGLVDGYRVVISTGPDGGQTVDHLHLHVLGGRAMHWPPG
jgi:histidine triad (HIT) family protein